MGVFEISTSKGIEGETNVKEGVDGEGKGRGAKVVRVSLCLGSQGSHHKECGHRGEQLRSE